MLESRHRWHLVASTLFLLGLKWRSLIFTSIPVDAEQWSISFAMVLICGFAGMGHFFEVQAIRSRLLYSNNVGQQFFSVIWCALTCLQFRTAPSSTDFSRRRCCCSHELRGPCQSIINGARMLADSESLSPEQKQLTSAINMSGQSLAALLNDILGAYN